MGKVVDINGNDQNQNVIPGTNMILIDNVWMSGKDTVGAVLCQDLTMKYTMAYIGVGKGKNQTEDLHLIAQHGAKLRRAVAEAIFDCPLPDYKYD